MFVFSCLSLLTLWLCDRLVFACYWRHYARYWRHYCWAADAIFSMLYVCYTQFLTSECDPCVYESDSVWFELVIIGAVVLHILILLLLTLTLIQAKTSAPIFSRSFPLISMEFDIPLRLVDVVILILILFRPLCMQGREPYSCQFIKKIFNIGLYSDIYGPISVKLGMMIETAKLCILMSVLMMLTFIQGHSCMRNQQFLCPFFSNLIIDLDEIKYVATTCWFVEAHAKIILH